MKLFGITGGIAMGKSTAGRLLAEHGMAVIDTDDIARQLVEPGQSALTEIRETFGPSVLLPNGSLDRRNFPRLVFPAHSALAKLEAILHPRIRAVWAAEVETWRKSGRTCGAVIIPLLFETEAEPWFDAIICVACSTAVQARRLQERGWDAAQSRQRLGAQWPVEKKIARADYMVWSGSAREVHAAQLLKIIGHPPREGQAGVATS